MNFYTKKHFLIIFALFENFEVKHGKTAKKRKNVYCICVLELNLAILSGLGEQNC